MKKIGFVLASIVIPGIAIGYQCHTTVGYTCALASHEPHQSCPDNENAGNFFDAGNSLDRCVIAFGSSGVNDCRPQGTGTNWCIQDWIRKDCVGNITAVGQDWNLQEVSEHDGPCE
jgi:hypothetical protein